MILNVVCTFGFVVLTEMLMLSVAYSYSSHTVC